MRELANGICAKRRRGILRVDGYRNSAGRADVAMVGCWGVCCEASRTGAVGRGESESHFVAAIRRGKLWLGCCVVRRKEVALCSAPSKGSVSGHARGGSVIGWPARHCNCYPVQSITHLCLYTVPTSTFAACFNVIALETWHNAATCVSTQWMAGLTREKPYACEQ